MNDWNPNYRAWAAYNGQTPEAQYRVDTTPWPNMAPFIAFISSEHRDYVEAGGNAYDPDAFSSWLTDRYGVAV